MSLPIIHQQPVLSHRRKRAGIVLHYVPQPAVQSLARSFVCVVLTGVAVALISFAPADAQQIRSSAAAPRQEGTLRAEGCYLRVKDRADIPASERGILKSVAAEPGDNVVPDQVLAVLNDTEARLVLDQARLDLSVAEKRFENSVLIEIAEAALSEAENMLRQARLESDVAKRIANSDILIRQAEMDLKLAENELERTLTARKTFSSSVSDQQLDKQTQIRDTDRLKVEKARFDQATDGLRSHSKDALVEQHQMAVTRLQHQVSEERTSHAIAELNTQSLRKAVEIAEDRVVRRTLRSPLSGVVVEKLRHAGEWVEAGEPVLRVIRLDQLLVQGYVHARLVNQNSRGRPVRVQCDGVDGPIVVEGKLVFISPEIDATNQQVEVRAEINNPKLALRPGLPAVMDILSSP